jgi:hypothetical protein
MHDIVQHLKLNGEQLDSQIATEIGTALARVRNSVAELSARGDVILYRSIRIQGWQTDRSDLVQDVRLHPTRGPR